MLDLTVPMVEVWFAGAKLGEHANDLEALKAASLHADSLPLIAESVEYELRRDTMKYIVHRRITGPDAPALGPVLTISSTALTVTLDRPASGPTQIDRYELERFNGSAWVQIASGLSIFGATNQYADSSLTASTAYQYRCRAVDTTERASEYSYSTGTTSSGATNQAPVWATGWSLTIPQGGSVSVASHASDPEGDQLTFSKVSGGTTSTTMSSSGILTVGASVPVGAYTPVLRVSDGQLTDDITVDLTVTAVSGNTFTIPQGTVAYNAATAGVQGGDTIVIEADASGNRGPLKISNANGSSGARITIRNPTTKRVNVGATAAGGFIFELNSSSYVEIDGSYYSGETYGLNFTRPSSSSSVTSFVKFTGVVNHVTMRNFEINGKTTSWGSGITPTGVSAQDKTQLRSSQAWREDYTFENFYVHNLPGEGLYLGNNFSDGCIPSKNMIVQNGTVENVGRDGIQAKGWWSGTNRISGCTVSNVGRNTADPERGQRYGISVLSGKADVYNNVVLDVGESGIQMAVQTGPVSGTTYTGYGSYTTFDSDVYNNVVARVGLRTDALAATGNGITTYVSASNLVEPLLQVYNNTIVDSEGAKISFHADISSSSIAQNNILLGTGSATSIDAGTANNNLTTGAPSAVFVAPETDNYHLSGEQAVTAGLTSSSDIEGTSRAGTASKGAYEFA